MNLALRITFLLVFLNLAQLVEVEEERASSQQDRGDGILQRERRKKKIKPTKEICEALDEPRDQVNDMGTLIVNDLVLHLFCCT